MKIGVIGSGALGLYYGSLLQKSGLDVAFLLRRDYQAMTRRGLTVTSPNGDFHLPKVSGYRHSSEIGEVDLVLIGLKTYANDRLVEQVRPLVGRDTIILTLQNGLGCEDILADAFAPEQIVGGTAFLCCNRGKPGTVHHLAQGSVRLAELRGGITVRLERLASVFSEAGIPCEGCADLPRIRWEKLVWNIPFNGLCALTGLATDRLLADGETRRLIVQMMQEVVAAANRQGLTELIDADSFIRRMISVTEGMGEYRPSMMLDRLNGQPLELETIYQIPLQRAESAGMPMMQGRMLYALLLATEQKPQAVTFKSRSGPGK